jgi:iron complex outermembrane receptor protein
VVEQIVVGTAPVTLDFRIRLRIVRDEVTVTATGSEETSFNSIQSVTSLGAVQIAERNALNLGELLEHELGVAKRSFGPGTSRPVLRGFDGDRVLVLQDGQRIGSLGFQSGDHAEPIDPLAVEKIEVVKGPATLLYGSNAIGGVVNAISEHNEAHPGLRGYVTALGSTNNYQAGGSAGIELGRGNWGFWGSGGGQRAGDYLTPLGRVTNSFTRNGNGAGGFGYFGEKGFFSADYAYDHRRYGIPYNPSDVDEIVNIRMRRHGLHLRAGARALDSFIDNADFSLQYNDYRHEEIEAETGAVGTDFNNRMWAYRGTLNQRRAGHLSGSIGFSGFHRDFKTKGEEVLTPPTVQNNFALFALEKFDYGRLLFQFGGRYEFNGYHPAILRDRTFNGFSGAVGLRVGLWEGGAFVANYTHSYRAPSLEELYNFGPHPGNAVFEIGDQNLKRERGDGIELSLRHSSTRLRAEVNFFSYHLRDFIFLAPTGEDDEGGLPIAEYRQGTSRYLGSEARFDIGLLPSLWLLTGLDYVNAELTENGQPLPRIPPLRARVGLEFLYGGFRLHPEAIISDAQERIFPLETRTPGYTTFNLTASYTIAQQHLAQVFSVNAFNLGDRLYRNHLSFIKEFAPEIGRGLRLTYTLRFF